MTPRPTPEGIRITKVGLWYVLFAMVVAIAASNTGNNALYMVLAMMLAVLAVSGLVSRGNVRALAAAVEAPGELFARRPARVRFTLTNRAWWLPRWALLVMVGKGGEQRLVPHLGRAGSAAGEVEVILPRRGRHRLGDVHVASLFPFGLFRKGVRYPTTDEVLVFPELFPAAMVRDDGVSDFGEQAARRPGWGHDLHALRGFRQGDDPRRIHWKQTARVGRMVYMERETEENRRLAVLFDNGVGELTDPDEVVRFERLVSEAATAAADYLDRGFEVELVTRGRSVPFGIGRRQRWAVLETLAMVEPEARAGSPLASSDPRAGELRLAFPARGVAREGSR